MILPTSFLCGEVHSSVPYLTPPSPCTSSGHSTRYLDALLQIRQQHPSGDGRGKQKKSPKKWSPPPGKTLKINVDGVFIIETGAAAVGGSWRWLRHCRNVEEAEALACLEGIRLAAWWADRVMVLEADCSTVIDKLTKGGMDRSRVVPVIMDASCVNKVAHELAHLAIRSKQCCVSFLSFPECGHALLCNDTP
uniref:RNase H type-1 domain-containing protein n=1 Tax=Setaria italica TaxID=4555 RepID=K4AID3_SETIT